MNMIFKLTPEQKIRFQEYLPKKVYHTERNIAIVVAFTQLSMIALFSSDLVRTFANPRSFTYFCLYIFLFLATIAAIILYRFTVRRKKFKAFLWLRRWYICMLCIWVLGITYLEQQSGKSLSVYCYLVPTTAAVLLLTPLENLIAFGGMWCGLAIMLLTMGVNEEQIFANLVNSIFVTVLALFISYRYYQSLATEFRDRETIEAQYDEIQKANALLQQLVHIDKLTGLYNRYYLMEEIYPEFDKYRPHHYMGMFMMMDIDFFKQYNDNFGHLQGDECLKAIANILQEVCELEGASAIRYGGEEFLIVKISKDAFDAKGIAQRLLDRLKQAGLQRNDVEEGIVTVSAGLWYNHIQVVQHIEQAIKYADDALYQAKTSGRNRIVEYHEEHIRQS